MNKTAWLEAALDLIDTMPRDEFLSALHKCGVMDKSSEEVTHKPTYDLIGAAAGQIAREESHVWRCEFFRMDDELLSFFPKISNSAPQGALSLFSAA
ncbi:hypothetical protein L8T07_15415 [Enterobacter asburiae]|uniref:hypothetical protein n=1 Tax=Enterobacter asburiae TaxID=61645 RepID=UPI002003384A|nr:hypothetical protein [Enterobacter asburiae]MCK6669115.1 hypothetical protein [Enterobacter asburiae]